MKEKIAIVHDWLVTDAGAEKVLRAMLDVFPDADVFSLVDFLNDEERAAVLSGKHAKTSFLQNLPFAKKHFRNYLLFFPFAIESLDVSAYDLVISSSWAVAKGVKTTKNQLHISYCHTPIRYAWDLFETYTAHLKQPKKFLVRQTLSFIRKWDKNTASRVDFFLANSRFVQQRIEKTYGRSSQVLYPPVDTKNFTLCEEKEDFYLTASRLVPYKKTKLIVEAFNEMPHKKLYVIGSGEEFQAIQAIAKENVTLLGYQDKKTLIHFMQKAKAFVYAAVEDFGIVPIEALSCGTPVIALNQGATKETIQDGISGIHFSHQTAQSIIEAVQKFETLHFDAKHISALAYFYRQERFYEELTQLIKTLKETSKP